MDPQKLSQLDPKLREAYQRVMGTTIPQPQAPPVQTPAQTQTPPPPLISQSQSVPQPEAIPTPAEPLNPPPAQNPNFAQMNSEVPSAPAAAAPKKKNGMMPILFGIVGLIFIVIYTLFWTKIFNFKLPFLP